MNKPDVTEKLASGNVSASVSGSVRRWPRWRIVTDNYDGFEVQIRESWWHGWEQCVSSDGTLANTFETIEEARAHAATKPNPARWQLFISKVVEQCKH